MRRVIVLATACCMILISHAQRATNEPPYSLRTEVRVQKQDVIVLTAPDNP